MLKTYITTFYNIRYLKPYQIPISTAMWQPKYFLKDGRCFIDDNGVMNGIYEEALSPKYIAADSICQKGCQYIKNNPNCPFLIKYQEYLNTLDFEAVIKELERVSYEVQKVLNFNEEPEIILLVYEKDGNPCSERQALKAWFESHGYTLPEWEQKDNELIF